MKSPTIRKVVYNDCHGGFGLSKQARELAFKKSGDKIWLSDWMEFMVLPGVFDRHAQALVETVEELGEAANGEFSSLKIKEVAGKYRITHYIGLETVETQPTKDEWF